MRHGLALEHGDKKVGKSGTDDTERRHIDDPFVLRDAYYAEQKPAKRQLRRHHGQAEEDVAQEPVLPLVSLIESSGVVSLALTFLAVA